LFEIHLTGRRSKPSTASITRSFFLNTPQPPVDPIARLGESLRCLESRIDRLEKPAPPQEPKKKDGWEKFHILGSLLTPIVAGVLGYFLITTVNLSLQKQQLQLSGAKEMQSLLSDLGNPDTSLEKAEASAIALAAYGRIAVVPLINELEAKTVNSQVAAQIGLHAIGVQDHDDTCLQLTKTIDNRTRLYSWITHKYSLRLVGELGCQQAIPSLEAYKSLLGSGTEDSVNAYAKFVSDGNPPTLESVNNLKTEIERSLEILRAKHVD
jgi:hypothetical protein